MTIETITLGVGQLAMLLATSLSKKRGRLKQDYNQRCWCSQQRKRSEIRQFDESFTSMLSNDSARIADVSYAKKLLQLTNHQS